MNKAGPAWASAVAAAFFVSCGDSLGLKEGSRELPTACSDRGGTIHTGSIDGQARWRAVTGPHRVRGTVLVSDELVLDPGTLVCFERDAQIEVLAEGTLTARGAADTAIIFTAANPLERWAGILVHGEVALTHARLEHAKKGVEVRSGGAVDIERSVLRQIEGSAVALEWAARAFVLETTVDSACSSACTGAIMSSGFLKFHDSRIRDSGADGLHADAYSDVELAGGSIEGSKGIGLVKSNQPTGSRTLGRTITAVRPITITGGASYPARLPLQFAAAMLSSKEAQDGWRGNARDTVVALSEWYGLAAKLTIYPGLAWKTMQTDDYVTVRVLELEPGAAWTISGRIPVERFVSRGTAESPVTITASGATSRITLSGATTDPSRISHTRLTRTWIETGANHPIVLDNVVSEDGHLRVAGAGSQLTRVVFRSSVLLTPTPLPALTIAATDVVLSECEVTRSRNVGVRVEVAVGVRINDCNLHENAGAAIDNRAAEAVDARNNWWGDAAGPNGPTGNRVAGNVLFEPYRTQPVQTSVQAATARVR